MPASERTHYDVALRKAAVLMIKTRGGAVAQPDELCVPKTSSTSCDQAIFVDQATDASLPPEAVLLKVDRFG